VRTADETLDPSLVLALLLFCLVFSVFAKKVDSAKAAYAKGQDAEARQNYEQPSNISSRPTIKSRRNSAIAPRLSGRFLAASSEVHRGQILRDAGKFDEALASSRRPWRRPFLLHRAAGTPPHAADDERSRQSPTAGHGHDSLAPPPGKCQGPVELAPYRTAHYLKVTEKPT